jgi:predicted transcriptional regulator of viral defense system
MTTSMEQLRKQISGEEFDYQTLMDALANYAAPRDRVSTLLRQGAIIRIKKGLYIFGDDIRRKPICRELLANLIYGPSYISLDYALQYHSLIPERVTALTSVTTGRSRLFDTLLGRFDYRMIPLSAFRTGMDRVELADGRSFLIAIPEKALADKLLCERGSGIRGRRELQRHLEEELRIDPADLSRLDPDRLDEIAGHCENVRVTLLAGLVRQLRQKRKGDAHA